MVSVAFKEGIKKARSGMPSARPTTHIEERALGTDSNPRPTNEEVKERVPDRDTLGLFA